MIVLDEQLLGRGIESAIASWYPGKVTFIHVLRPGSVIKDDGIPGILEQQRQPAFATINTTDFWRKVAPSRRYCVICFDMPDSRAAEISQRLRLLPSHPSMRTMRKRMGKVVRVLHDSASHYDIDDLTSRPLD